MQKNKVAALHAADVYTNHHEVAHRGRHFALEIKVSSGSENVRSDSGK